MKQKETKVEYITKSRTIHEINNSIAIYNFESNHFRVFESFANAKAFINEENIHVIHEFDSKEDLNSFLENTEICSVCGEICWPDDECYNDEDSSDACCTNCCFYDEADDVYRKGTKLEYGLKKFIEDDKCPHCGSQCFEQNLTKKIDGNILLHYECANCEGQWHERYVIDKVESGETEHRVTSENEDSIISENKAMKDYLEKQIGFNEDDITNITNNTKKLYCVHLVHENNLEHYSLYSTEDKAKAKYLELCRSWYAQDGVDKFRKSNKSSNEVEMYDSYDNSDEYYNAGDNTHVTWEKLS